MELVKQTEDKTALRSTEAESSKADIAVKECTPFVICGGVVAEYAIVQGLVQGESDGFAERYGEVRRIVVSEP